METDTASNQKVNILIVDDRQENVMSIINILETLDQNLITASSGKEALKNVLENDFAVILLDVQMPEMDGFETAELIRTRDKSKLIPLIFITALKFDEQDIFRGYSAGAVDYLVKPINPEVLLSKVKVFIQLYKQRIELIQLNETLQRKITELSDAQNTIKVLQGLLPICSRCKKIKDENGSWNHMEGYITKHSEAKFSHGMCPDCMKEMYPDYYEENKEAKDWK